ncbi:hypothetical protein JOL62DRAFT_402449 [Phyllosticta paracitricarpa]|uniref:Uncharacterized protein n=1 Tax=Phyllosticta paracitricarpa TaxID=2016321 RepID=A0ABR1NFZ5_9PEZI
MDLALPTAWPCMTIYRQAQSRRGGGSLRTATELAALSCRDWLATVVCCRPNNHHPGCRSTLGPQALAAFVCVGQSRPSTPCACIHAHSSPSYSPTPALSSVALTTNFLPARKLPCQPPCCALVRATQAARRGSRLAADLCHVSTLFLQKRWPQVVGADFFHASCKPPGAAAKVSALLTSAGPRLCANSIPSDSFWILPIPSLVSLWFPLTGPRRSLASRIPIVR